MNIDIWSTWFWFAPGVKWEDLVDDGKGADGWRLPAFDEYYVCLVCAAALFGIRFLILEPFVFRPIANHFGVKKKRNDNFRPNEVLEDAFKRKKYLTEFDVEVLSKQTDLTEKQISSWFRKRKNKNIPSEFEKFNDSAWKFVFYFSSFTYGLIVLWQLPWFWNTRLCWDGYPKLYLPRTIYWYYMVELGFYWKMLITQFRDVKRKDFWQMCLHHVVTILLMTFSWFSNFTRIGSLVVLVHDAADYWMELAKMAKYVGAHRVTDASFIVFTLTWAVSRLYLYPTRVVYSAWAESWEIVTPWPAWWFFNIMLVVLQVLHVIWFYMILKIAYMGILVGSFEKDIRSSCEEDVTDSDHEHTSKKDNNNQKLQ